MSGLFAYGTIGTLAGAVAATTLVVQAIKRLAVLGSVSPRLLAYLVATVLMFVDSLATGALAWSQVPLLLLNGLLVASSAMGTWQVATAALVRPPTPPGPIAPPTPLGRGA